MVETSGLTIQPPHLFTQRAGVFPCCYKRIPLPSMASTTTLVETCHRIPAEGTPETFGGTMRWTITLIQMGSSLRPTFSGISSTQTPNAADSQTAGMARRMASAPTDIEQSGQTGPAKELSKRSSTSAEERTA